MPRIARLEFPAAVVEKLWALHRLTPGDVEQVVFAPESDRRWDVDAEHGGRVIVRGYTSEVDPRLLFVALRPLDIERGTWAIVTAFAPTRETYAE